MYLRFVFMVMMASCFKYSNSDQIKQFNSNDRKITQDTYISRLTYLKTYLLILNKSGQFCFTQHNKSRDNLDSVYKIISMCFRPFFALQL